jgi:tetratricopeptide (TPR) repeat protein
MVPHSGIALPVGGGADFGTADEVVRALESVAKKGGGMRIILLGMLLAASTIADAQSVRSLINGGNDLYKDQKFTDAEVSYRKALEKEQALVQGHFNLGNALAKQGKNDEAAKEFEQAIKSSELKETKADGFYNIGNTRMAAQQYGDAIKSYIDALKINPNDEEAKYNLSYALSKLRQQQQQQQQQKQNDKNKQDNKDNKQQQQQQKNQDQQNKQDKQQNKQQNKDEQQQQKQQQQQQEKRMSKSDAERILEVLKNSEKDVQKKLHVRPAERAKTDKDW